MAQQMTIDEHRKALAHIERQRRDLLMRPASQRAIHAHNQAVRDANRAFRVGAIDEATGALSDLFAADTSPAMVELMRADDELYAQGKVHADAIRTHIRDVRQAKINARQTRATYAAMCNDCFQVHAGECP